MDSAEVQEREKAGGENHVVSEGDTTVTSDTASEKLSNGDYSYEDDFEELDSSTNHDKSHDTSSSQQSDKSKEASDSSTPSTLTPEKDDNDNEAKMLSSSLEDPQSDDSEPEPEGEVLLTEDQQRAMMELLQQKQDSGDYSDDPPEYNVKERLKELNAELAMEPDPDDRQHRVGFKEELVDLVAPPPEVSDEEDTPRKTSPSSSTPNDEGDSQKGETESEGEKKTDKQFVVERDGKFDVLADHELTASERAMFNIPTEKNQSETGGSPNSGGGDNTVNSNNSNSGRSQERVDPRPPNKPRPSTASGVSSSRRNMRPSQSPRPRTASAASRSSGQSSMSTSTSLLDFNYNSPYAMSDREKEQANERARQREHQRHEEERRRKEEEERNQRESEDAFQAWLRRKRENDRQKQPQDDKKISKEERSDDSEAKENEEAFKGWLKTKQSQLRTEKLLKKREEQEIKDGYYVRSREECDQAYKEWLRNKYAEIRRQRAVEKQRSRAYRSYARRSRRQQLMAKAVRQSQAFRYVDYYGYRF